MTFPGLVAANNLADVVDRERAWDNLGQDVTDNFPIVTPSLDLNFAVNKSLIDDISGSNLTTFSRASTGTFVGSNGLIQTAASGVARFDHNPATGESLGLLIEEARTNIIVSSESFNTGGWTQDGIVLTASAGTAPDGASAATSISVGTGSNRCFHFDNSGVTGAKVFSIFAKANTGASFQIASVGDQTPNATATINLSTATVTGFSGASIIPYANGWYRILLPVTVSTASGSSTYWQVFGPTSSVFVWGAQLEAGSFATSYIPTTAVTVTRAAESLTVTGANFSSWYNESEGTLAVEMPRGLVGLGVATNITFFGISTGALSPTMTTGNGIKYANGSSAISTRVYVETGGSAVFDSSSVLNASKVAIAYKINDFAAARSGTLGLDAIGNVPIGMNTLTLRGYGATIYKRFTYYPVRLYNTGLQYITSTTGSASSTTYPYTFSVIGKSILALNEANRASTRDFVFIKGLLSPAQPRLNTAASNTASGALLRDYAMPKASPTTIGNYFFSSGLTLSGVSTRINGTPALSIATSPFSGSTATSSIVLRELQPQANWRITEPMVSGAIASPELAIPFETNDFVLFMKAGQN
jgi:hypothetical protein